LTAKRPRQEVWPKRNRVPAVCERSAPIGHERMHGSQLQQAVTTPIAALLSPPIHLRFCTWIADFVYVCIPTLFSLFLPLLFLRAIGITSFGITPTPLPHPFSGKSGVTKEISNSEADYNVHSAR
jgi:hypothetical protein